MGEPKRKRATTKTEDEITTDEPVDADDAESLLDEADDAITAMVERERRRDGKYDTAGDDHDPGIDVEIDSNAPKELERSPRKRGST